LAKKKSSKSKSKNPVFGASPNPKKRPVWQGSLTHHNHRISWRFSAADNEGDFAWANVGETRLKEVHDRLCEWEAMDMASLLECRNCYTDLSKLSSTARKRLEAIQRDDAESLYSYRVTKKARLWCMDAPDEGVMYVLWWDPNHLVYPSGR
jgi:hypothetical protein